MAKKNKNPMNEDEKERQEIEAKRVDPAKAQETDDFSEDEQKAIVQMVLDDYEVGSSSSKDWKTQREKDLQQIHAEKPSIIESLKKKAWQSDRNLGLCPGVLDIYQATLTSTCYNPESIHFKDTEENDIDNKDNLEKFSKWMVSPQEINLKPEVDDFIHNRVGHGTSYFKIDWEVKYEWVDKRIPIYEKKEDGKGKRVKGYEIESENRRFERCRIRNIDNIDDILLPSYGKYIQELPFMIEIVHIYLSNIEDMAKRNYIKTTLVDKKKTKGKAARKLSTAPQTAAEMDTLRSQKALELGIQQTVDPEGRDFPIDLYEWYGYWEKKGKRERYRFLVEPVTETFMSGKPLRKIRRDNKYPYAGGPFRRVPGQLRGLSLTQLIAPIINALNNNYNSTNDYQTINNMPFGFANFDEGFAPGVREIDPGKIYPTDGDPSKAVYFPSLQRSLAWSYQDKQFLLEMLERLTGAASYFLTSSAKQATATRDNIVEEKGDTKFGIWVSRIQDDIVEAINMAVYLYQDWAPPGLGKRVLGEKDGKQLIRNLSIDTLRGSYDAYMVPDITSGSKSFRAQRALWMFGNLQQGSVWFNPQMNPRGNWLLTKETMLKQGIENPEHYLPPMPNITMDADEEAVSEWGRFKQGEVIDPPEGATPAVVRHFATHQKQNDTQLQELDKEYRGNFEDHLFKTYMNYAQFMQKMAQEQQSMQLAGQMTQGINKLIAPTGGAPAPGVPPAPIGPGGPPGAQPNPLGQPAGVP